MTTPATRAEWLTFLGLGFMWGSSYLFIKLAVDSFGTFTLRGRNLTDTFYADWSGYASGLVFIGAPRSVDLSFTRRF